MNFNDLISFTKYINRSLVEMGITNFKFEITSEYLDHEFNYIINVYYSKNNNNWEKLELDVEYWIKNIKNKKLNEIF